MGLEEMGNFGTPEDTYAIIGLPSNLVELRGNRNVIAALGHRSDVMYTTLKHHDMLALVLRNGSFIACKQISRY
jgi:hypothetical protein